ncbi:ABC-type Fe3+ transport system, periplasmic component [Solibacillus silvestris StLB046]|uniref:ABC-type Fe3+ transport system, periplasmic component n=1 Tax=Solibacillus silvestris (strain StLB046) TaxID=1002809 RepID=F2F0P9_SOLSS|nr:ABC-type Fe3+ transport system, periplasmic component [Solibacillus silvestris StLB046]
MKKKVNVLILLLMVIFMVGCTDEEKVSITDGDIKTQEVTTDNTTENSEREKKLRLLMNP